MANLLDELHLRPDLEAYDEAEKKRSPNVTDYLRAVATGYVGDTARGLGELLQKGGIDYGARMREAGDWLEKQQTEEMSPGGRRAFTQPVFTENKDGLLGVEPNPEGAWGPAFMQAARSAPQMAMMAAPAAPVAGALRAIPAVARAVEAGGFTGKAADVLTTGLPFGAAEGAQAGLTNAAQTRSKIEGMTHENLLDSPEYRDLFDKTDASLPEKDRSKLAKDELAARAASEVFNKTLPWTGAFGAVTGGGAPGMAMRGGARGAFDVVKSVAKGAGTEALQEFPQSGGEQYFQNVAEKRAVPTQDPWEDVLGQALGGAAVGAVTGAPIGAAHAIMGRPEGAVSPVDRLVQIARNISRQPASATPASPASAAPATVGAAPAQRVDTAAAAKTVQAAQAAAMAPTPDDPVAALQALPEEQRQEVSKDWPKMEPGAPTQFQVPGSPTPISGRFALAEADSLVASHNPSLQENPAYPKQLQPRDRTAAGYELQVAQMSQNLQPAMLGASPSATDGAPIVGPDGVIESGNGRWIALQRAYSEEKGARAQAYRDWLGENAPSFGLKLAQIEAMKKPVLVRERMTPLNRAEFARAANAPTTAQMGPLDQAKADAQRMGDLSGLAVGEDGNLFVPQNQKVVRGFFSRLPITEQTGLVDKEGRISQTGQRRFLNAVILRAYGEHSPAVMRLVESVNPDLRGLLGGLTKIAPMVAKARDAIAAKNLADRDLTGLIVGAVDELIRLKSEGKSVADELAQAQMFTHLPEGTMEVLAFLDANSRNPAKISQFVLNYLGELARYGQPGQNDMFGAPPVPGAPDLVRRAQEMTREQAPAAVQPGTQPGAAAPAGAAEVGGGQGAEAAVVDVGAAPGAPETGKPAGSEPSPAEVEAKAAALKAEITRGAQPAEIQQASTDQQADVKEEKQAGARGAQQIDEKGTKNAQPPEKTEVAGEQPAGAQPESQTTPKRKTFGIQDLPENVRQMMEEANKQLPEGFEFRPTDWTAGVGMWRGEEMYGWDTAKTIKKAEGEYFENNIRTAKEEVADEATKGTEKGSLPDKTGSEGASLPIDEAAHAAATSPKNALPEPTQDQKEAGNYQLGHLNIAGLDISIENPEGSIRKSKPGAPVKWETKMQAHYGYVKGVPARAPDKEHVDVFVKPGTSENFTGEVFVVDQNKEDGSFDEPKVMIGWPDEAAAREAYLANYQKGWESRIRGITGIAIEQFKTELQDANAFLTPQVAEAKPADTRPPAPFNNDDIGKEARGKPGAGWGEKTLGKIWYTEWRKDVPGVPGHWVTKISGGPTVRSSEIELVNPPAKRPVTPQVQALPGMTPLGAKGETDAGQVRGDQGQVQKPGNERPSSEAGGGENLQLPEKTGAAPSDEKGSEAPPVTAYRQLANWVAEKLAKGEKFSNEELTTQAAEAFGGTAAAGRFSPRDAYDAMELGVNLRIARHPQLYGPDKSNAVAANVALNDLEKLMSFLPTQTKRTNEQIEYQQFSTPPTLAYLANWVANPRAGETVLEPSAGTGDLAVFAKMAGAKVVANEITPRRADILKELGFEVTREDAEQINNVLPATIKPTLVLMNPPFSSAGGRIEGQRNIENGIRHLDQAWERLEPGGRMVALMGENFGGPAASRRWLAGVRQAGEVRALVTVSGKEYAKYGTTYGTSLMVLDKTGKPQSGTTTEDAFQTVVEALAALEGVRNERSEPTAPASVPEGKRLPVEQAGGEARPDVRGEVVGTGAAHTEPRPTPARPAAPAETKTKGPAPGEEGPGQVSLPLEPGKSGQSERSGGEPVAGGRGAETAGLRGQAAVEPGGPGAAAGESTGSVTLEKQQKKEQAKITGEIFEAYSPAKVKIPGAKPHISELVESAAMSSVLPPDATYTPNLPDSVVKGGKLSDSQLEAVVYAGQAHQSFLPNGDRRGFFIGDGTGVGKGREIGAILLDNLRQGRKKAVWVSEKQGLIRDAQRDYGDVGGHATELFPQGKVKASDPIERQSGILFTTYSTLRSSEKREATDTDKRVAKTRVKQLTDWLGPDFDGVIIFDESHNMQSSMKQKGKRGIKDASLQALAGLELQRVAPKARVVYSSATGATNVANLGYAQRLGLWGEQTAFTDAPTFVSAIDAAGVSAMELVARDLKQMGMYIARSLSFKGVTYERVTHELSPVQRAMYDRMADGWQTVLKNINEALEITGAEYSGAAKAAAMSRFWGAQQRFFNQVITSMQMPTVLERIDEDLKRGDAVVLQLVNTMEAELDRKLALVEEDADLQDLDMTPRDALIQMVQKAFPVQEFHVVTKDGNEVSVPVLDSEGNPVLSKVAIAMRDALIKDLEDIKVPDAPLDMILKKFGPDMVAEVTGRSTRVVPVKNEAGETKMIVEKRTGSAARADADAFMDDKKRILVFSGAGGTGYSFHSDRTKENQRKRQHYGVQLGWRADQAIQGMGRTHRSNEANQPNYKLAETNLKAQKRFISSIARALDRLGALTKGQRQASGQQLFDEKDNLEGVYAGRAIRQLIYDSFHGNEPRVPFAEMIEGQMGLNLRNPETGVLADARLPDVPQFLNRLLSLKIAAQDAVFDAFFERMESLIETAKQRNELDVGVQSLGALEVTKQDEQTVYTDQRTGAETKIVRLNATYPREFTKWKEASERIAYMEARKKSDLGVEGYWISTGKTEGRPFIIYRYGTKTLDNGAVEIGYRSLTPLGVHYDANPAPENAKKSTKAQVEKLWDEYIDKQGATFDRTEHVLTGTILPVWDRMHGQFVRVVQTQTKDGERLIGRWIAPSSVEATLKAFGMSEVAKMTPEQIRSVIMDDNMAVVLANGWTLMRTKKAGEMRLEIVSNSGYGNASVAELERYGAFTEVDGWKQRTYLPVDQPEALERLLKVRPAADIIERPKSYRAEQEGAEYQVEIERLEKQVDEAYERGDKEAENLDAKLAALRDREDEGTAEPEHYDYATVEEQLANAYYWWLQASANKKGPFGGDRSAIAANMRDAVFPSKVPDEQILDAAKDAYDARNARAGRRGKFIDYVLEQKRKPPIKAEPIRDLFVIDPVTENKAGAGVIETLVVTPVQKGTLHIGFDKIDTPEKAAHVFANLRKHPREHFNILLLDENDKPIAASELFQGTVTQVSVYPREVVTLAYQTPGARKIWFAHVHPSGVPEPSHADEILTRSLAMSFGKDIGIELMGHIIIAGTRARAFYLATGTEETSTRADSGIFDIPPASRKFAIPLMERMIRKNTGGTKEALNSPRAVRDFIRKLAPGQDGLLWLDAQHRVQGWQPMTLEEMGRLRTGDIRTGAAELFRRIGRNNPAAAIAVVHADADMPIAGTPIIDKVGTALRGLKGMLSIMDVQVLDGFIVSGPSTVSLSERGVMQDTPKYSVAPRFGRGMTARQVQESLDRIAEQWNNAPTMRAVGSEEELPDVVRTKASAEGAKGRIQAVFDPVSGVMHIVAPAVGSAQELQFVVMHEVMGHYGLRGAFGQDLDAALQYLWTNNPRVRAKTAEASQRWGYTMEDRRLDAIEEAVAELAAEGFKFNGVRQFFAAVQSWLRLHGMGELADWLEGLTDAELTSVLTMSRAYVVDGGMHFSGQGDPALSASGPTWYSALRRHVDAMNVNNAGKEHWQRELEAAIKSGKVKKDEIEWSGISEWLKAREGKIAKDDVLAFLGSNGINPSDVLPFVNLDDRIGADGLKELIVKTALQPDRAGESEKDVLSSKDQPVVALEEVKGAVAATIHDDQVHRAIISRLPVDVVDDLAEIEATPEDFLRNPDVVMSRLAIDHRGSVANGFLGAMRSVSADFGTKFGVPQATRSEEMLLSTLSADDLGSGEVVGPPPTEFGKHKFAPALAVKAGAASTGTEDSALGVAGGIEGKELPAAKLAEFLARHPEIIGKAMIRYAAENAFDSVIVDGKKTDITPAMRESVMRGLPLFAVAQGERPTPDTPRFAVADPALSDQERANAILTQQTNQIRPLESLFKGATELTRLPKLTGFLYDKLVSAVQNVLPESAKAGLIDKYGVPEYVQDRFAETIGRERQQLRETGNLLDRMPVTREEARVAYQWLNQNAAEGDKMLDGVSPESQETLRSWKEWAHQMQGEAVRLGQLDGETAERNEYAYTHRSYLKYEQGKDKKSGAGSIRILGDQYRTRGLTEEIDTEALAKWNPQWWERMRGKEDIGLKGKMFLKLEKRVGSKEGMAVLPGVEETAEPGKVTRRVYWPADQAVPARFADYDLEGTWEARWVDGKNVTLWRDFTPEERKAMGEIDDARYAIAKTSQLMIHDIEVGKLLEWLANHEARPEAPRDAEVVTANESLRQAYRPGTWVKVPESNAPGTKVAKYGKLAGLYIPGPIWNEIRQVVNQRYKPLGETYDQLLRLWKISKTALSPAVHMNNVMANVVMAEWQDLTAAHMAKAFRVMFTKDPAHKIILDKFEDAGGSVGMWTLSEIQKSQMEPLLAQLEREAAVDNPEALVNAAAVIQALQAGRYRQAAGMVEELGPVRGSKAVLDKMIEIYQGEDQLFRLAAFLKAKEDGATDTAAGKFARESFLDYHITAPWINIMRSTAFPFVAFTYRALPLLAETMAKKPWKMFKFAAIAGVLDTLGYALSGGDEDKERKLLPEEKSGSIWGYSGRFPFTQMEVNLGVSPKLVRMPWNDQFGSPVFLDIRRFVPLGDIVDVGQVHSAIPLLPTMMPGGPLSLVAELVANRSFFTGKEIVKDTDTDLERTKKLASYVYQWAIPNIPLVPGSYSFLSIKGASAGETDVFGRERSIAQAAGSALGVRLASYPEDLGRQQVIRQLTAEKRELGENVSALRRQFQRGGLDREEFDAKMREQLEKRIQFETQARRRLSAG